MHGECLSHLDHAHADHESIAEHSQVFNMQAEHALDGLNEVPS